MTGDIVERHVAEQNMRRQKRLMSQAYDLLAVGYTAEQRTIVSITHDPDLDYIGILPPQPPDYQI